MITIIDYGAGNLKSVENALCLLGCATQISGDPDIVAGANKLILPGVGSFGAAMEQLRQRGLVCAIRQTGAPILGICLGLQLLFDYSEESGCEGLGLLPGRVAKIPPGAGKVPHTGWNSVRGRGGRLYDGGARGWFYFVHSYHAVPGDEGIITAVTDYGAPLCAAVEQGSVMATQFHPEKSGDTGLALLKRFASL